VAQVNANNPGLSLCLKQVKPSADQLFTENEFDTLGAEMVKARDVI